MFSINNEIDRLLSLRSIDGFDSENIDEALSRLGCIVNRLEDDQEFEWVAEYADGTSLHQIDINGEHHHFGHIDQTKLVSLSWVHTISIHRYIKLIMSTGLIETNLPFDEDVWFMTQELGIPNQEKKKPILVMRKRETIMPGVGSISHFRYILGWETEGENKDRRVLIISPNGKISRLNE